MATQGEPARTESFWRGPVTSERGARRIIAWTAWPLIALSLPVIFNIFSDVLTGGHTSVVGGLITLVVLNGLGVSLLRFGSRVAAVVSLVITSLFALVLIMVTAVAGAMGAQGKLVEPSQALILPLVTLMWLALALLSWRAVLATSALRRMQRSQPPPA